MTLEPDNQLSLEIGHVLFIDIVGYSKLLIEGGGVNSVFAHE